jgi:hypothetical protein
MKLSRAASAVVSSWIRCLESEVDMRSLAGAAGSCAGFGELLTSVITFVI